MLEALVVTSRKFLEASYADAYDDDLDEAEDDEEGKGNGSTLRNFQESNALAAKLSQVHHDAKAAIRNAIRLCSH